MIPRGFLVGPAKLYVILLFVWCMLAFTSPVSYEVDFNYLNVAFIVFLNIAILFGMFAGQIYGRGMRYSMSLELIEYDLKRTILPVMFYIGVVGFLLKIYVLFFVKGAPLTLNVIEIRLALINDIGASQGGILSVVAALLYPLCFLYVPLYFSVRNRTRSLRFMFFLVILMLVSDALLSGGGTSIIITFLYVVFSLGQIRVSKTNLFYLAALMASLLVAVSFMWLARLEIMFGGVEPYLKEFNGGWIAYYDTWFTNEYREGSVLWSIYYIYSWLSYYFVHGVFEFVHLINEFDLDNVTYGVGQTFLFYKFFGMFGAATPTLEQVSAANIVAGHYQTFWGLAFIDFGYFVLIEALLVGFICSYLYYARLRGRFVGVLFYPYIQTQIIYSFLSNSLNGQVTYLLFSGVILVLLLKVIKWWRNEQYKKFTVEQIL